MKDISRKSFIKTTALGLAGMPLALSTLGKAVVPMAKKELPSDGNLSINIFSKHLQWLDYKDMATLAAQMGFDGVDLTVRADGHVKPEHVTEDLPKAVDAVRQAGLNVYTITTDIRNADDKNTANVLKTAAALGIKNYRMGWYSYDSKLDIPANLEVFRKNITGLAAINKHYQIHGDYENHTGRFAGPLWDLWMILKDIDPQWMGCQFDIRHATADGAEAWPVNLDLLKNHIGSIAIKDFYWEKVNNKWTIKDVPLGQGMVDFKKYFAQLKKMNFNKPISLHFEYPLGGANNGTTKLTIPKDDVIKAMQTDLETLKGMLKEAGLT